jgi:hypothetical protein
MVIGLSLDEVSTEQSYNYLAIFKRKIIEQGGRPLVHSAG